ncbi:unnamed protein product [Closterium sp. NIES-65]|nr:unnamed protein product [Closterium sp. NIES-65]
MGNGRKGNKAKKGVDMAQETDVPALPLKETAATGKPPLCPAPATLAGPFEAFHEQQGAVDQDDDATRECTGDGKRLAEGDARDEGDATDTADDDAQSTGTPADDDDDGYLSDDSDDHLEPDSLNSIIALKRFSLTLLVPIARKAEVKRAAFTVAAMLDEWKDLLSPDALLTTTYQDLAPMLLAVVVRWGGLEFLLIAAYIPAQAVNRSSFYRDSLEPFLQSLPVFHHILVMGDLNVVKDPDLDRTSQAGSSAENHRLLSCWRNTDLRDAFRHIHLDKREYTFFARATRSSSRIDRALISQPLLSKLVEARHVAITNGMTDHWSGIGVVLESAEAVKNGPGIWRLRADHTQKQGVQKIIKKIIEESAGASVDELLERLTTCLKAYSREERKREKATQLHLIREVERLRLRVSRYPHCQRTGRTLLRKEELLEAYERSHKEQLQLWAGIEAEMDGEVASGTLSAQIKTRKAKTTIREVARNGSLFSGVKEVLSAATSHFRDAFGCVSSSAVPATEDHPMQQRLGEASRRALSAPWTEDEVRKAIRELAPRKSPGADGLPKELFDYNWGLLGPVLMDLVRSFTGGEALPHTVSTAVTILLHKKGDKGDLGNYRPITLLSTVYKIIAKVMASRLKVVLHEVISEDQYGFLPGRQLADTVSVVADAIEAGANGKEDWYLMMIDFQKAFDSISRDYLFGTLRKLGLPEVFVSWTEGLHKDAGTCLHINGWTGDRVAVEKGVRQGCPLAPYLFLCAVEPLCQEFNRKKLGIGKRGVGTLAYLGYADDTSLLLRGAEQLKATADVLTVFGRESGLVVNEGKTVVFPLGKNRGKPPPHNLRYKWADKEEPERLLGIWITPNGDPTPSWNKALGRAKGELAKWEMQHPTTSVRVTIINSYITPIFLFQAQIYLPPEAIWKKIRKICHTFVSKGEAAEEKRFILWNYQLVCTPRKGGGLGLICLEQRVNSISIRNVCRLMLRPSSVKKWLAERAAEMPPGLDTIFAHKSLLDHWEKGSARWKELIVKFWDSPLYKTRVPTNRWEVEQEHLAFNPNIPYRGASPFGNQKGTEALLGLRMGDLIVKSRDGTCELKKLEALARELGNKEKAKWALRAFQAAPPGWRDIILTKLTSEEVVATVKLLRSHNAGTENFTYWKVEGAKDDKVVGILCDVGSGGYFTPYVGNLTVDFGLRSGVPMYTEGHNFLGPMGDVRTKLLLSQACEGGELISLRRIRMVLASAAVPHEDQRRGRNPGPLPSQVPCSTGGDGRTQTRVGGDAPEPSVAGS